MRLKGAVLCLIFVGQAALKVTAQQSTGLVLKQLQEGEPAEILSAAERSQLGDPVFNLLLKTRADVVDYPKIEEIIQPKAEERHTFVVDEEIANPKENQARRAVVTFTGSNGTEVLTSNVMFSVFFDAKSFPAPKSVEAWGWDNFRGRYNYYKLDKTGTLEDRFTWKFRGSSVGADMLTPGERGNTCLACHINGAPIMKELALPWNNWHSSASRRTYLTSTQGWPVSKTPALAGERLKEAETLEVDGILPSITQFNIRRINEALLRRDLDGNIAIDEGNAQVVDGKRLLKSLFFTTEYNITSSKQKSGLHPFSPGARSLPASDVEIPKTFFLNANLIAGGTAAEYLGLGITEAASFGTLFKVRPAEYKSLVEGSNAELGGRRPADSDFAWFVPEPSHIDNDMVDRLIRRGIISKDFAASVIMIDLERPVLSRERESLWQFIPDRFSFSVINEGSAPPDVDANEDLRLKVIAALEAGRVTPDSSAGKWLKVLRQRGEALPQLRKEVIAYLERTKNLLDAAQSRPQHLKKLHDLVIERRQAVLTDPLLRALNETGNRLFAVPETIIENPHHQR